MGDTLKAFFKNLPKRNALRVSPSAKCLFFKFLKYFFKLIFRLLEGLLIALIIQEYSSEISNLYVIQSIQIMQTIIIYE